MQKGVRAGSQGTQSPTLAPIKALCLLQGRGNMRAAGKNVWAAGPWQHEGCGTRATTPALWGGVRLGGGLGACT